MGMLGSNLAYRKLKNRPPHKVLSARITGSLVSGWHTFSLSSSLEVRRKLARPHHWGDFPKIVSHLTATTGGEP